MAPFGFGCGCGCGSESNEKKKEVICEVLMIPCKYCGTIFPKQHRFAQTAEQKEPHNYLTKTQFTISEK